MQGTIAFQMLGVLISRNFPVNFFSHSVLTKKETLNEDMIVAVVNEI